MKTDKLLIIKEESIAQRIFFIRNEKVMLDLAKMYDVEVKYLKRQVRRNIESFPDDFMFQLTQSEYRVLRSQIGTLEGKGKYSKYTLYAFTEQGVAMLSGILKSKRARDVNIAIMRTFVRLRRLIDTNKELSYKMARLEKKLKGKTAIHLKNKYNILHSNLNDRIPHPAEGREFGMMY